jgi:mono/diheme cytochrome c family protein
MLQKELRPLFVPLALAAAASAGLFAFARPISAADSGPVAAFISTTCIDCHGPDTQEAGLRLDTLPLDPAKAAASADTLRMLVRVHDRVRDGEMPPKDVEQPSAADRQRFVAAFEPLITAAEAQAAAGTGRTTIRRMSRIEYENTLRDLLALPTLAVKDLLPEDGRKYGFDKVAGALDISYVQMQRYLETATAALSQAVVRGGGPPERKVWRGKAIDQATMRGAVNINCGVPLVGRELAPGLTTHIVGDPVNNPGNCYRAASFRGSADSAAVLTGVIGAHQPEGIQIDRFRPPVAGLYKVRFSIWGLRWERTKAGPARLGTIRQYQAFDAPFTKDDKGKWEGSPNSTTDPVRSAQEYTEWYGEGDFTHIVRCSLRGRPIGYFDAPSLEPTTHEFTVWLTPDDRISFHAMTLPASAAANWASTNGVTDYEGPAIAYDFFEVDGPLDPAWPPESRRRLFGSVDGDAAEPADLLRGFASRAFRRPVEVGELGPWLDIVRAELAAGRPFDEAMLAGYKAILCAPDFLLIGLESGPPQTAADKPARLGPHALASRLAYFLWDSPPDDELLSLASAGELAKPEVLGPQVERMLADRKSDRFVEHFLDDWLQLRDIDFTTPDPKLYPDYDPWLRDSMLAETRGFFRRLLDKNLGVGQLIDSDTILVNQRLAQLYGIKGVFGADLREHEVPAGVSRGGLITQASILKVTANGTATSPVLRGVWVMERLLGVPRLPPPPNIPAIEPDATGATTIRQMVEMHRADNACAVCHDKMDPYGLAMEGFDPIGGQRDRYRLSGPVKHIKRGKKKVETPSVEVVSMAGNVWHLRQKVRLGPDVDPSGTLADGRSFRDVEELKKLLLTDEDAIAKSLVQQLVVYATGSGIRFSDRNDVDAIVKKTKPSQHGLRSLLKEIVLSDLFHAK